MTRLPSPSSRELSVLLVYVSSSWFPHPLLFPRSYSHFVGSGAAPLGPSNSSFQISRHWPSRAFPDDSLLTTPLGSTPLVLVTARICPPTSGSALALFGGM